MKRLTIIWLIAFVLLYSQGCFGIVNTSKIAFTSRVGDNFKIYTMDSKGGNVKKLTRHNVDDCEPSWSPDGTKIVFVSNRDGNDEIYVMNTDGGNQKRLTKNKAEDLHPSWSPDGKKIIFQSNRDGNFEIYVMNSDGSSLTRLTNNDVNDITPRWSPDGKKIAFASDKGTKSKNFELYLMNNNGSEPKRLTFGTKNNTSPSWSPDCRKIVFDSGENNEYKIFVIIVESGDIRPLTKSEYCHTEDWLLEYGGDWTSDGKQIIFSSNTSGRSSIYVIDQDGKNSKLLAEINRGNFEPSWWSKTITKQN